MEKMLVTQALDERDFLEKRILDAIHKTTFVDTKKSREDTGKVSNRTEKEFETQVTSELQKIRDLIVRYDRLEAALITSNATTFVNTTRGKMSVAAAITLRKRLRDDDKKNFESVLSDRLESQFKLAALNAEKQNRIAEETAESMRLSILGKDSTSKIERPLEVVDVFLKENKVVLLDPVTAFDKANEITDEVNEFLRELDTVIKVSNATTFVEF